jgi:hypothetical protein
LKGGIATMAEKIYTIPINEAFDQYDGCPLCRLRATLDEQSVTYVMGAAMMEPDVRIRTNQLGFCRTHFAAMRAQKNRLSLALILESHLDTVAGQFPDAGNQKSSRLGKLKKFDGDPKTAAIAQQAASCYVCQRVAEFEGQYVGNVVHIWKKDAAFREKLQKQPFFCLEHYTALLDDARKSLSEDAFLTFRQELTDVMTRYLTQLRADNSAFCKSFDHENARKPLTEAQKTSVERAIAFLAGE